MSARCLVMSFNLLNWGMFGPVAPAKVAQVRDVVAEAKPDVLCLAEVGPEESLKELTDALASLGVHYKPASLGYANTRGIRNAILALDGVEVIEPGLKVPLEMTIEPIQLENFNMGGVTVRLSREPLAVLVRTGGHVLAIGFYHPKSKYPEDMRTGKYPKDVPNQTYFGTCKMISSLRNFAQCLLARQWVDCFWDYNPHQERWNARKEDVRFVLVGDWNANPIEEQRMALRGYADAGLPVETLMRDDIGSLSNNLEDNCTIPWAGVPNSFDAIYTDYHLGTITEARVFPVDVVDLFGYSNAERERLENMVLDHRPVGLFVR